LAGANFGGPFHLAGEVVGDNLLGDGFLKGVADEVGGLSPAHVFQHHHTGEEQTARIDHILVGVFGGGAVGSLEQSHKITDVGAGGNAQPANLRGQGVAQVIAVEVGGG